MRSTAVLDAVDRAAAGTLRALLGPRSPTSGRFARTLPRLLGDAPFARFLRLADWLHRELGRAHAVALEELHVLLLGWLVADGMPEAEARQLLEDDYAASGARGRLPFAVSGIAAGRAGAAARTPPRQRRRLAAPAT